MDMISGVFGGGAQKAQKQMLAQQQKSQALQEKRIAEQEATSKKKESALRALMSGGAGRNALQYSAESDSVSSSSLGSTFG